MKKYFAQLSLTNNRILFLWIVSLGVISITFLTIYFKIKPNVSLPVALHYNVIAGVDLYGKGMNIYKIPLAGLLIVMINFVLYRLLKGSNAFLSLLTAVMSCLITVILFIAVLFLLQVN